MGNMFNGDTIKRVCFMIWTSRLNWFIDEVYMFGFGLEIIIEERYLLCDENIKCPISVRGREDRIYKFVQYMNDSNYDVEYVGEEED